MADKTKLVALILMTLLLCILWGCFRGQSARLATQNETPVAVGKKTTNNVAANSPKSVVKGDEICERHLLKKISEEKAEGSQIEKLNDFRTDDKTLPPNLKKWLETADKEALIVYELRYREKRAIILGSTNVNATGLAANFQYWYVRFDNRSIEFISLSEDPGLIFLSKEGLLNYYAIDYSHQFLENKDWNNLTLNLIRYSITPSGESQIISEEQNIKCE